MGHRDELFDLVDRLPLTTDQSKVIGLSAAVECRSTDAGARRSHRTRRQPPALLVGRSHQLRSTSPGHRALQSESSS